MELNEMEKRLLFQVEGDYQSKVLNELYMTTRYTKNPEQRKAAENLMAKLRILTDAECIHPGIRAAGMLRCLRRPSTPSPTPRCRN